MKLLEVRELAKPLLSQFPESVFVVAIRGYYKDTMGVKDENDIGIFDDAMFLIGPNLFLPVNANTDPSKHREGIATLITGLHYFKPGKHGITRPGGGYPAFTPDTADDALPVTRWGRVGVFRGVKINLHRGGQNETTSEGCQTVIRDQWLEFQETAYKAMNREGQRRLPYILIENN
jgi:lysozyme